MALSKLKLVLVAGLPLLAATAAVFAVQLHREPNAATPVVSTEGAGVWYCPMHTHITSDHEGSCPICGMNLVEGGESSTEAHMDEVSVSTQMQERLGLSTEVVQPVDFTPSVEIAAQVVADERRAVTLSPKVEGWIRRLGVAVVGQSVRTGQLLYEIYSPELQDRQKDYIDLLTRRDALLAAKNGESGMTVGNSPPDLMLASVARERFRLRKRLLAADVPPSVLDDLERFRRIHEVIPVLAAQDGVITGIGAREGAYVRPGEIVVSYADRHAAWAEIVLTPDVLSQLRSGDEVELHSTLDRAASVRSPVDPATAVIDPISRTARVRVPLESTSNHFLPGTLLAGRVHMQARRVLTIPTDSVLRTGRGDFVILADSPTSFRQVPVTLGAESDDRVEVLEGLSPGLTVITNGQFMLSAESSLQSSWRRFAATERSPSPAPAASDTHAP